MRKLMSVAVIGFAVAAASTASAQGGRPGRPPRAGVMDTARMRRMDSLRVARGDTMRRPAMDSARMHRLDSLRAAGALDSMPGRGRGRGPGGRGGFGPGGRMGGPGAGPGLMGIQLSDAEKANLKSINEKYRGQLEEIRKANVGKGQPPSAEVREQIKAIGDQERAEIRAALTPEHQAQFDANLAKMPEGRGRGGPPGRRPPPPPPAEKK